MKEMKKRKIVFGAPVIMLVLVLALVSCEIQPEAPQLPPVESMEMDFSDFDAGNTAAKSTLTRNYFSHSAYVVGWWSVASRWVIGLPVAAYEYALTQEAVMIEEGVWEWSFEYSYEGQSYLVFLTAVEVNDKEFTLEMELAFPAFPNARVTWFEGVVRHDHSKAEWDFFYGQTEWLSVDWMQAEDGSASLQYTFMESSEGEKDSYITWAYDPAAGLDASFHSFLSDGETMIEWNTTALNGRVKSTYIGDGMLWHCWDDLAHGLADIECE